MHKRSNEEGCRWEEGTLKEICSCQYVNQEFVVFSRILGHSTDKYQLHAKHDGYKEYTTSRSFLPHGYYLPMSIATTWAPTV